jgi:hypothetical protein
MSRFGIAISVPSQFCGPTVPEPPMLPLPAPPIMLPSFFPVYLPATSAVHAPVKLASTLTAHAAPTNESCFETFTP